MHRTTHTMLVILGLVLGGLSLSRPAQARLAVVASTPDLASIATAIGGNRVEVTTLSLPSQDPHWVDARPHLALALSQADLLLVTGSELEVGWLPTLLTGARNGKIQPGAAGYLDGASLVELLEVATGRVDRSAGDVHVSGNPHYTLDPRRVARIAVGVGKRLTALDPAGRSSYLDNTRRFIDELTSARLAWEKTLKLLKGRRLIAYHRSLTYLSDWLGFSIVDHLEPRPGIPPNPRHIAHIIDVGKQQGVSGVIQEVWFPKSTSQVVANKLVVPLKLLPTMPDVAAGQTYIANMNQLVSRLAELIPRSASPGKQQ